MKFTCERCEKRYATAETPVPGRVYKIRCRACGHLIIVKGSAVPSPGAPAVSRGSGPAAHAALSTSASRLEPLPPEPRAGLAEAPTGAERAAQQREAAPEFTPVSLAAAMEGQEPFPAADEQGFIDLFAEPDGAPGATSDEAERAPPLASAGRASSGFDPFAPDGEELRTPTPEPLPRAAEPAPSPKVPALARPAQKTSAGPIFLIAAGGLVLLGILAFVLFGGRNASSPPGRPASPTQAELQPPPSALAPAAPARAQADRAAQGGERVREEKRRRASAAADSRDRPRPARAAREGERTPLEAEPAVADGSGERGALTEAQIQKVLAASRSAFETCIATAGRSEDVKLDGRHVTLRLYVHSNGAVTYPSVDDPTVNGTDLGSCLKSSARLLTFPKFRGETILVEVPLVLTAHR